MDYGLPEQTYSVNPDLGSFEISTWIIYAIWIFGIFVALWLIKKLINFLAYNSKHFDHIIYQVKLPKDKPGEKDGQSQNMNYLQKLKEDIARGETVFKAIGGLRAQRWYKGLSWLFGRNDNFSFEIVASQKLISFYVVAPRQMGRYMEQQIQAAMCLGWLRGFPGGSMNWLFAIISLARNYPCATPNSPTKCSRVSAVPSIPTKVFSTFAATSYPAAVGPELRLNTGTIRG